MKQSTIYDIPLVNIAGEATTLAPYAGQVLLVVNVASKCGFTPQYAKLEALQQANQARGVTVLGFPSNQFLNQEPGSNAEINSFAHDCYNVTFPMFDKVMVNGPERAPVYQYIAEHIEHKPWKLIPWNFTKILIDQTGRVRQRYLPTTSFKTIQKAIDRLLTSAA